MKGIELLNFHGSPHFPHDVQGKNPLVHEIFHYFLSDEKNKIKKLQINRVNKPLQC